MKKLAQKLVPVPHFMSIDMSTYSLEMSLIPGKKLKDFLNDTTFTQQELKVILAQIGHLVRKVHDAGVIHGDLTTSNMIRRQGEQGSFSYISIVDFGLSYFKESAEDRAVDLYVLERAFKSTHPQFEDDFSHLLVSYGQESALKKLEVVRQRGRKKVAFG